MVLPGNERGTGNLPPGVHPATLQEVERRFANNVRRREIFDGLEWAVKELHARGVVDIWVDGSFITKKARPRDVDVIFSPVGIYGPSWGLLHFHRHEDLKQIRRVDLWAAQSSGLDARGQPRPILEFFQADRNGRRKGIIKLVDGKESHA